MTQQWAHASGIIIFDAAGAESLRYQYGDRSIRRTTFDSNWERHHPNKIGSLTDQVLLFCYHYDPAAGKYTFAIVNALRVAGTALVPALGLFMFVNLRRDRRQALRHS